MPRNARMLVPNCPHHIVQRGHNRKAVFVADEDYRYYVDNLKEFKEELQNKWGQRTIVSNIDRGINGVREQLFLI